MPGDSVLGVTGKVLDDDEILVHRKKNLASGRPPYRNGLRLLVCLTSAIPAKLSSFVKLTFLPLQEDNILKRS